MDALWRTSLWQQLGATVDMLDKALTNCPSEHWRLRVWDDPYAEFWNIACHALFWLDLHLSGSADAFQPPPPIPLDELDPAGRLPARVLTQVELQRYGRHVRSTCERTLQTLTDEQAHRLCVFPWGELPYVELLLYSMRHVQEHAAQLNLVLGQRLGVMPGWIAKAQPEPYLET
jgi:hypothetical protein